MKILVTGAAGFIGSTYTRMVLDGAFPGAEDAEVTALDLLTYAGNRNNLPAEHPRMTFVRGDVCDAELLSRVVPGHDAIVHFAAESHVDRSITGASEFVRTNVLGTQKLFDAALRAEVARVVHVSTDEVYGSIEHGAWDEQQPLAPNSPYAASKAASDLLARSYWRTHGLPVQITRCSNNYGPYQHPEKFIPRSVTRLLDGGTVPLYGDGLNVREWIHVEDHCRAVHLVLAKGTAGEIYNVDGGRELPNLELTRGLLRLCGREESAIERVADRAGHDRRYALDGTKIRDELGYRPLVDFSRGLADTVAWYREHQDWWRAAHAAA